MKRPLPLLSLFFLTGAFAGLAMPSQMVLSLFFLLLFAAAIKLLGRGVSKTFPFAMIFALLFVFGLGLVRSYGYRQSTLGHLSRFHGEAVTLYGEVRECLQVNERTQLTVYVYYIEQDKKEYPVKAKVLLGLVDGQMELPLRELVKAAGTLRLVSPVSYRGQYDLRGSLASDGVFATVSAGRDALVRLGNSRRPVDPLVLGERGREYIGRVVDKHMREDSAALQKGLLIGGSADFSEKLKESFRRSGMNHIVAVSGMHVSIFLLFVSVGVWRITAGRRWRAAALLTAVLAYCVLIGPQPTVLRAAGMAAVGIVTSLLGLRRDTLSALLLTTAVLVFANPYILQSGGFQLSFAATLGIIVLDGVFTRHSLPNAGISAFLFTAPLLAKSFYTVNFASVFTNILVSPLVILSTVGGYIMCVLPFGGRILAPALHLLNRLMILVSDLFAGIPFLRFSVPSPPLWALAASFLCLYALYRLQGLSRPGHRTAAVSAGLAVLTVAFGAASYPWGAGQVHFLPANGVGPVTISTAEAGTVVIDSISGPMLEDFLRSRGKGRISALVLTDYAYSNQSGAFYILEHMPVGALYLPRSALSEDVEFAAKARGVPCYFYEEGGRLVLGDIRADVLAYDEYSRVPGENSAALGLTLRGTRLLLCANRRDYDPRWSGFSVTAMTPSLYREQGRRVNGGAVVLHGPPRDGERALPNVREPNRTGALALYITPRGVRKVNDVDRMEEDLRWR